MNFTSIRKIDKVGRIGIPIDIRKFYGFLPGIDLKFISVNNEIIISKSEENTKVEKSIDKQGRLLIPKKLRTEFQLKENSEVMLIPREDGIHLSVVK